MYLSAWGPAESKISGVKQTFAKQVGTKEAILQDGVTLW